MFIDEKWQQLYSKRLTASLSQEIFGARRTRVQVIMEFSSYHEYCRARTRRAVRKQGGKFSTNYR